MAPAEANTATTTPTLPDDVLVEIFLRLPAKLVLRFRTVCKQWRHLLSDPIFIRDHHRLAPIALLLDDTCIDNGDAVSALPFPYGEQSTAAPLYCGISSQHTYLEGLPADLGQVEFVGFYRHAPSAEYRVLCHNYHSSKLYEYLVAAPGQPTARQNGKSIGPSNLWIDDDFPLIGKPVSHRGCLYWLLWRPSMGVVVFDTISEDFRLMRGPVDGDASMDGLFDGQLVGVDGTLGATLFAESEGTLKEWWAFRYNIDISFLDRTCGGGLGF
ncbi:hypothetical protein ACQ4PT_069272 [Festuca glaucescens]